MARELVINEKNVLNYDTSIQLSDNYVIFCFHWFIDNTMDRYIFFLIHQLSIHHLFLPSLPVTNFDYFYHLLYS